jgi:hypothetical protein
MAFIVAKPGGINWACAISQRWNTASKRRDLRWLAWCRFLVRPTRIKVLVHDGIGAWPAARRLNAGKFIWPREGGCHVGANQASVRVSAYRDP